MKTRSIYWTLTIIFAVIFSSCSQSKVISKAQKTQETKEKIAVAKKLHDEASKTLILMGRRLTIAKNRIKYGDSASAANYRPIAQILTDSLTMCQVRLSNAKTELELAYGKKIKTTRVGKGKPGKQFAQSGYSINIRLSSGAPACVGGQCGGRSERRHYMGR